MIIIMFGAPGVGKGTQAAIAAERKNILHLSTGEAFRNAISAGTEMGNIAKNYVESGGLVPDEIVTGIVKEALQKPEYSKGAILDGFPRTLVQARSLDDMLSELGKDIKMIINITLDGEEIVQRMLKRGRQDDNESIIRHRLNVYNEQTAPLLEYYQSSGKMVNIDGNADVETVHTRINQVFPTE
jgi:adenylate kinase